MIGAIELLIVLFFLAVPVIAVLVLEPRSRKIFMWIAIGVGILLVGFAFLTPFAMPTNGNSRQHNSIATNILLLVIIGILLVSCVVAFSFVARHLFVAARGLKVNPAIIAVSATILAGLLMFMIFVQRERQHALAAREIAMRAYDRSLNVNRAAQVDRQRQSSSEIALESELDSPSISSQENWVWLPEVEDKYLAEVYTSGKAAARGIAKRISLELPETAFDIYKIKRVRLHQPYSSNFGGELAEIVVELNEALTKQFPEIEFKIVERPSKDKFDLDIELMELQLESRFHDLVKVRDPKSPTKAARLFAVVSAEGIEKKFTVNYVDKLWVNNFNSFLSGIPNRRFLRAESNQLHANPELAYDEAIQDAATQLLPSLKREMHFRMGATSYSVPEYNDHGLRTALVKELAAPPMAKRGRSEILVQDRYAQGFEVDGNVMWRDAILVEVNGNTVNELANELEASYRYRDMQNWSRILSVVGLFGVVLIVFFGADAATRGYYTTTLVVFAVLAVFGGMLLMRFVMFR